MTIDPQIILGETGRANRSVAQERPILRASGLPDAHHSTLLSAVDSSRGENVPTGLAGYLHRVAELQEAKSLFEKVEIEINVGCNRRCTYCNLATARREDHVQSRRRTMEWSLYQLLIRQLHEINFLGVLCFHFFSEPLLNKNLAEYVSYARRSLDGTRSILYTNGDYLTAQRHRQLTAAGLSAFVVTRHDDSIPEFLAPVLRESNVILDARSEMTLNNRAGVLGSVTDDRIHTLPCIYTSEAVVVTIDGNVLPCSCDFSETIRFGNIKEMHIADIFESERCRAFRADLLSGRRASHALCRDCDVYCEVLGLASAAEPHRKREQLTTTELRRNRREAARRA